MSKAGIRTVCYNWMPVFGWFRSRLEVPVRGGALATAFCSDDVREVGITTSGRVEAAPLWSTLEYFLSRVVPIAERYRIKLALHPDDPPVASLAGVDRILISSDAMMRAVDLVPSEFNGIAFCQGTFATMGCDVPREIRRFDNRIHFAHFRDVSGTAENFVETFADDGMTDMAEAIEAYHDLGFSGVIRPDHTPTFIGEDVQVPGYGILGNLYAVGYLKGLMEAVAKRAASGGSSV
jgi:mannonate dehydratase